jgi:diguanylate cyclase
MDQNPYRESKEQASEYLRLTTALLANHGIPASPFNYRMGYDYMAGNNNVLRKALDDHAAQPGRPLPEYLWSIYQRTYVEDSRSLEIVRTELRGIIDGIQRDVSDSGGRLSGYVERLQRFAALLEGTSVPAKALAELRQVIAATLETEQSQRRFNELMIQLAGELDMLRKELAQAKEESLVDFLTGLANRKAFDAALGEMARGARRDGSVFSVLIADIDYFKQVNDKYGHLIGDKVLRFVASILKHSVKGKDVVARFGGEEFAVILINADSGGALTVAEQIRQAVFSGIIKDMTSQRILDKISVSIGVTQFSADDLPVNVLQRADAALCLAKERGRNRVEKR